MIGFMLEFVNQIVHRRREQEELDSAIPDYHIRQDQEVMMMDILEREKEAYMQEVDHGWDDAWADHYFGEEL